MTAPNSRDPTAGEDDQASRGSDVESGETLFEPPARILARLCTATGVVEKWMVLAALDGAESAANVLSAARVAARLEREDPRRYRSGRAVSRSQRDAVHRAALDELCESDVAAPRMLAAAQRRYPLLLVPSDARAALRAAIRHHDNVARPLDDPRWAGILATYIRAHAAPDDHLAALRKTLAGRGLHDVEPTLALSNAATLYLERRDLCTCRPGDPALFFVRSGRWTVGKRQVVASVGEPRHQRTEGERRRRGVRTTLSTPDSLASRPTRELLDAEDVLDARRARAAIESLRGSTRDPRELAACLHLLNDVPLTDAAATLGVSRQAARTGKAKVIEHVRNALRA